MISNVIARRYAKALIATLEKSRDYDVWQKELTKIYYYLTENPEVAGFLDNPSVSLEVKRKALSDILQKLGAPALVSRFIQLLLEKDRLRYLDAVLRYFEEIANQKQNRLKIAVRGAAQLNTEQIEKIKGRFRKLTGKEIILKVEVDPEIIGGLVVKIGSTIYNGSVKGQLERLKHDLSRG